MLKEHIKSFKESRDFWKSAACHILTDTDTVEVLEYRDEKFGRAEISVLIKRAYQAGMTVYPVLDEKKRYSVNGEGDYTGSELMECGIDVTFDETFSAKTIKITEK